MRSSTAFTPLTVVRLVSVPRAFPTTSKFINVVTGFGTDGNIDAGVERVLRPTLGDFPLEDARFVGFFPAIITTTSSLSFQTHTRTLRFNAIQFASVRSSERFVRIEDVGTSLRAVAFASECDE
jgi:hypothetical protein